MKQTIPFFKTIAKSFNPLEYDELSDTSNKETTKYFFSYLFLGFVLLVLLLIPTFVSLTGQLESEFSKFDKLSLNIEHQMNEEANIEIAGRHLFRIDTRAKELNLTSETFLITSSYLYKENYKFPFSNEVKQIKLGEYKNLVDNKSFVSQLLTIISVLLMPSLLILGYGYLVIKYALIIIIASGLALILSRVLKFDITYLEILKICVFSTTPLILLDIIRVAFNFNFYYLNYAVYAIFVILGIGITGEFEERGVKKKRLKRRHKKDYVEIDHVKF
ncbi:DUF1189 family protein [Candidatus Woesearchaeota archaeon]|jgi:hypothetical protein|nr:DUF1189 family protein [Candidatus Woesearchaeota archaeon]